DPLLAHLRARGLTVARLDAFSALPFVATPRPPRKPDAARRSGGAQPKAKETVIVAPIAASPVGSEERLTKLIDRLQNHPKARPVRHKTLLSHINGFFGNLLSEPELDAIVTTLQQRGLFTIDPQGRVKYPAN